MDVALGIVEVASVKKPGVLDLIDNDKELLQWIQATCLAPSPT